MRARTRVRELRAVTRSKVKTERVDPRRASTTDETNVCAGAKPEQWGVLAFFR